MTHYTLHHQKSCKELIAALKVMPADVTDLNLAFNELGNQSSKEIAEVLSLIPSTVTILNLSFNELNLRSEKELSEIFQALPRTVRTLHLTDNKLGEKSDMALVMMLRAMPSSVTVLNVSYNKLEDKTAVFLFNFYRIINDATYELFLEPVECRKACQTMLTYINSDLTAENDAINFPQKMTDLSLLIKVYERGYYIYCCTPGNCLQKDHPFILSLLENYLKCYTLYRHALPPTEAEASVTLTDKNKQIKAPVKEVQTLLSWIKTIPSEQVLDILTLLFSEDSELFFIGVQKANLSDQTLRQWVYQMLTGRTYCQKSEVPETEWFKTLSKLREVYQDALATGCHPAAAFQL